MTIYIWLFISLVDGSYRFNDCVCVVPLDIYEVYFKKYVFIVIDPCIW